MPRIVPVAEFARIQSLTQAAEFLRIRLRARSICCAPFACAVALAAFAISGCGGGAASTPNIIAKPAESGGGGGAGGTTNGGTAGDAGGGTKTVASGFGTFAGVVKYNGTPPKMNLLDSKKDPICYAHADKIRDESLIVGADGGIKNVFVYLQRKPGGANVAPPPSEPVIFDQEHCTFTPHAILVRAGQPLKILNSDNTLHNTKFSPLNSRPFDQSVQPNDRSGITYTYEGGENSPVQVKCSIHPWMTGYHLPLDHDFVALTDQNGRFEVKNLPAGEHDFVIWHEKGGFLNRRFKVAIQADGTTEETVTFEPNQFASFNGPAPKTVYLSALP